ncbi:MAG: 1,4-dihydroxy-2-naphthoate polyprenyltransferase [Opitutales bacterium]
MANPWVLAARPRTLGAAVAPVMVGTVLAYAAGQFEPIAAVLCLLFAVLIQVGTNYANDYFDAVKGADTPERAGPTRAVAAGLIAPQTMKRGAFGVLAVAFLVGMGLVPFGGWWLVGVGVVSVISAVAYTAGPLPLAYVGLGDVFVFIFFGLVAVGFTYFVQVGSFSEEAWLAGACCGALAVNILVVNNVRDRISDEKVGKRTLAVRFGRMFSIIQFSLANLLASFVPVYLYVRGDFGPWILLPVPLYFLGSLQRMGLLRAKTREQYGRLLSRAALTLVLWSVLFTGGVLIDSTAGKVAKEKGDPTNEAAVESVDESAP